MAGEDTIGVRIDRYASNQSQATGRMQLGALAEVPDALIGTLKVEEEVDTGKLVLVAVRNGRGVKVSKEVKFSLTGIISDVRLLPLLDIQPRTIARKGTHLKQQIVLVGHDSESFEMALESLHIIRFMFIQHLPADAQLITMYDREECGVLAQTSYLTRASDCEAEQSLSFSNEEDPTGALTQAIKSRKYIRSQSNVVELKGDMCQGDIATAGIRVEAEKKGDNTYHMSVKLEYVVGCERPAGTWKVPPNDCGKVGLSKVDKVGIARKVLRLRMVRTWDAVKAANHIYGRQGTLKLSCDGLHLEA